MSNRFTPDLQKIQHDSHDLCSQCGHTFREGDTAHAGYAKDGSPLYVGDCCKSKLSETAGRFYWTPRPYDLPSPESPLGRYMDFSKFVALLRDKALYFAWADLLGGSV